MVVSYRLSNRLSHQTRFALVLAGDTRCLPRNGGVWAGHNDGYVGVYGCGELSAKLAVLWFPNQGSEDVHRPIDAGVDGQSRSVRLTKYPLSTASDPHGLTTTWFDDRCKAKSSGSLP
ncbi:hypothetical protein JK2ML_1821 [Mycobacterium leprae Kyoto-2]|uniref:Uncharacterized protein n=3 Tax=Mycobacterium leprae TaxID=1769 RepID=Q9CBL0_MYCLE|nr:hypothetical protein DIJ64_10040 [Mycobacterium leprae]OAR19598.1 hypothetical protein A8144_14025 [Mycobacterium leprae 3125609]OAX70097.1 hypothetical protein A3216_14050 [Mycobacterium leprae 7935681]CAR71916.1 very hypothetical protein [Mycobacterium leprae Br4923]BBC17402.1 hypothetical protein JK2ML_1821 [Mycobacterium leprae Kyoto-2]